MRNLQEIIKHYNQEILTKLPLDSDYRNVNSLKFLTQKRDSLETEINKTGVELLEVLVSFKELKNIDYKTEETKTEIETLNKKLADIQKQMEDDDGDNLDALANQHEATEGEIQKEKNNLATLAEEYAAENKTLNEKIAQLNNEQKEKLITLQKLDEVQKNKLIELLHEIKEVKKSLVGPTQFFKEILGNEENRDTAWKKALYEHFVTSEKKLQKAKEPNLDEKRFLDFAIRSANYLPTTYACLSDHRDRFPSSATNRDVSGFAHFIPCTNKDGTKSKTAGVLASRVPKNGSKSYLVQKQADAINSDDTALFSETDEVLTSFDKSVMQKSFGEQESFLFLNMLFDRDVSYIVELGSNPTGRFNYKSAIADNYTTTFDAKTNIITISDTETGTSKQIQYLQLPVEDQMPLNIANEQLATFLEVHEAYTKGTVLVHCDSGVGRTGQGITELGLYQHLMNHPDLRDEVVDLIDALISNQEIDVRETSPLIEKLHAVLFETLSEVRQIRYSIETEKQLFATLDQLFLMLAASLKKYSPEQIQDFVKTANEKKYTQEDIDALIRLGCYDEEEIADFANEKKYTAEELAALPTENKYSFVQLNILREKLGISTVLQASERTKIEDADQELESTSGSSMSKYSSRASSAQLSFAHNKDASASYDNNQKSESRSSNASSAGFFYTAAMPRVPSVFGDELSVTPPPMRLANISPDDLEQLLAVNSDDDTPLPPHAPTARRDLSAQRNTRFPDIHDTHLRRAQQTREDSALQMTDVSHAATARINRGLGFSTFRTSFMAESERLGTHLHTTQGRRRAPTPRPPQEEPNEHHRPFGRR